MTHDQIEKERAKFEAHFSQAPYEWPLTRWSKNANTCLRGHYHGPHAQLSWEAWLARAEQDQALRAAVLDLIKYWDSADWKWHTHLGEFINKMRDLL